ncbi:MAG: hypothetical protein JWO72_3210 [Caulobacteraceae bacterium]|nr:hypothetical protein [Caulobacteraceae bacterium]
MVFKGVGRAGGATAALAAAWALAASPGSAASRPAIYEDPAQILKMFPASVRLIPGGVGFRVKNGEWIDVIDRPLVKDTSVLCLYAPSLHLAALCETDGDTTVTVLVDLLSGHRKVAPGRPAVLAEPTLVAIGPTDRFDADSLTLVHVTPTRLVDEGGALFDDAYGPGGWVDADCYRLKAKAAPADGWLEKTPDGWLQVTAAQSTVCGKRHGG